MSAPVRPGTPTSPFSRRDVLKVAGAIGGTLAAVPGVHAQNPSSDVIRIGLIGAGGRGPITEQLQSLPKQLNNNTTRSSGMLKHPTLTSSQFLVQKDES